jgi:hypothetical protein
VDENAPESLIKGVPESLGKVKTTPRARESKLIDKYAWEDQEQGTKVIITEAKGHNFM